MAKEQGQATADALDRLSAQQQSVNWYAAVKSTLPVLVGGLLFAPLVLLSDYIGSFTLIILVFAVMISGFDLMFGWSDLYVFCPAAFVLIGGVTSALLVGTFGLPFLVAFFAAGVISAITGLLIAIAVVTIGADFDIVIATLAFGEVLILLLNNWKPVGPTGIFSISQPALGSVELSSQIAQYSFLLAVVMVTIFTVNAFTRSRLGTLVVAMAENEDLFQSIGYNPAKYKFITILLGTFLLGIGGSLYAHVNGIITPRDFGVHQTLFFVLILLIGGMRSTYGPLIGAVVMVSLPEVARLFGIGNLRPYLVGGFLIVVVLLMPRGIVGKFSQTEFRPQVMTEKLPEWRS